MKVGDMSRIGSSRRGKGGCGMQSVRIANRLLTLSLSL